MQTATEPKPRNRWFRRSEERALTRATVPNVMLAPSAAGVPVNPRAALAVGDVFACVRALVDAISSLPLIAYRRAQDGARERYDGPLAALLRAPSPGVPAYAFLGHLATSLVTHGDGFVGKFRDGDGAIRQLGVLDPERIVVEVRGGIPLYTITTLQGETQTVTQRDILHVRSPLTLDGVRGLSPIAAARDAFGLATALSTHSASSWANDARPSGILTVPPGPEGEEVAQNLASSWQARHGGPANASKIAVLLGSVSFQAISLPAADAQLIQQRELSTAEICRIFRVPPEVVGAKSGDSMTYSNIESRNLAFVQHALRPWLVAIEQSLAADADLCGPDVYVEFLLDALLRADSKTRSDVYAAALSPTTGWMRRDEVRRLENLPAEGRVAVADA